MSKNVAEPEGPQLTSQHGAYALPAGLPRLHACTRMHTPTRPSTHIHASFSAVTMIRECSRVLCFVIAGRQHYNVSSSEFVEQELSG
jgi:hypothetical protein